MAHADSFGINISIEDMHRLTVRILDASNAFQNANVTINERFCVSPSPYYLDWFEKYYPNVPLNLYEGPFCLQCMNGIQGTKPEGWTFNQILDAVVTNIKYKKITIYHAIYIKLFYGGTVSYLTDSTDDILNTTNNETPCPELRRLLKKLFILNSNKNMSLSN